MTAYIVRRLVAVPVVLFILSIAVFFMVDAIPGDIVAAKLENSYTPARAEALRAHLGLDRPVIVQYGDWLGGIFQGDFGNSLWNDRPIRNELWDRLPVTLELGLMTLLMSTLFGVGAGIIAGVRQNKIEDHVLRFVTTFGLAIPVFVSATLVVGLPPVFTDWSVKFGYVDFLEDPFANLGQVAIPAAVGALAFSSILLRLTRVQVLEAMRQDYVRTARAKGLLGFTVIWRHVLKNAMIPVVTVIGLSLGGMISGSVFLEQIFSLPGLGRYIVNSVNQSDYPAVQAFVLLAGVLFTLVNLIIDLTYTVFDPRIRYS